MFKKIIKQVSIVAVVIILSELSFAATIKDWDFNTPGHYDRDPEVIVSGGYAQFQFIPWCNTPDVCDHTWTRRKKLTITGSTAGAVTNYAVRINLGWEEERQPDYDDIRFTAANGTTLLDYYRESFVAGTSAIFWVRLPNIPASPGTVDIWLYYGNQNVTTTSNLAATFPLTGTFTDAFDNETQIVQRHNVCVIWGAVRLRPSQGDLIINNQTVTLAGTHYYDTVEIRNNGVLAVTAGNTLTVHANSITVDATSRIDVDGRGYAGGAGGGLCPANGGHGVSFDGTPGTGGGRRAVHDGDDEDCGCGGGGGAYGGAGGKGGGCQGDCLGDEGGVDYGAGGGAYGSATDMSLHMGSGGGGGTGSCFWDNNGTGGAGGRGGGAVYLDAPTINIAGLITANGAAGAAGNCDLDPWLGEIYGCGGGGGGSGGTIIIRGRDVTITGTIRANGGAGGPRSRVNGGAGGGGSGGRIKIFYQTLNDAGATYQHNGGASGGVSFNCGADHAAGAGGAGTLHRGVITYTPAVNYCTLSLTTYSTSGFFISVPIPNATNQRLAQGTQFSFMQFRPGGTDLRHYIQYWDGDSWELIPDSDLPGNSTGFNSSPVNLTGINKPAVYSQIRIRPNFYTSNNTITPELYEYTLTYRYRNYVNPEPQMTAASPEYSYPALDNRRIWPVAAEGVNFIEVTNFIQTLGPSNTGTIRYQITNDSFQARWYYYSSTALAWLQSTSADPYNANEVNDAATIAANISKFDDEVGVGKFFFRAFMHSSAAGNLCQLDNIRITYTPPPAPVITSISPSAGETGTEVTITGNNFCSSQVSPGLIRFSNGTIAVPWANTWSNTQIKVTAPCNVLDGFIRVTNCWDMSADSTPLIFDVENPQITTVTPAVGTWGTPVTITGDNFGSQQCSSYVVFARDANGDGTPDSNIIAPIVSWTNTSIQVRVPAGAADSNCIGTGYGVRVYTGAGSYVSNCHEFNVDFAADISTWPFVPPDAEADYVRDPAIRLMGGMAQYEPGWWNTSWQKRRQITILGTTAGLQTDYQLRLQIPYDADMQPDWDDVRFISADHATELHYWRAESADSIPAKFIPCDNTQPCIFYVRIPNIPASPEIVNIWLYYGNSTAASTSAPHQVFPFYSSADSTTGWTLEGLWGQRTCNRRTPNFVFSFNDNDGTPVPCGDYDHGNLDSSLISPLFNIPPDANSEWVLYYHDWAETENGGFIEYDEAGDEWDRLWIYISTPVNHRLRLYSGTWDWAFRQAAIPAAQDGNGRRLRFRFQTVDGAFNDHNGWFLDDMFIKKVASPEPTYDISPHEDDRDMFVGIIPTIRPAFGNGQPFYECTEFTHTLGPGNTGAIRYQISNTCCDAWAYWGGTAWVPAPGGCGWACANDAATINTHIAQFDQDIGNGTLYFKAYFSGLAGQKVELDNVDVECVTPPVPQINNVTWEGGSRASCVLVTIDGVNFGLNTDGNSKVYFNEVEGYQLVSWTDTQIRVYAAMDLTSGSIIVSRENKWISNAWPYTVSTPSISSLTPATGYYGAEITIAGNNFGTCQGSSYVLFPNNRIATVVYWSNTQVKVKVPYGAKDGNVQVCTLGGGCSAGVFFDVGPDTSTWPFTNAANYTYNSNVIDVTGGLAILEPTNWWDPNWTRRRRIRIIGSTYGAVTNYPIRIQIPWAQVSSAAQTDWDDIRFVAQNQSTVLDYFREGRAGMRPGTACAANADCVFWVEIPTIPSATATPSWTYIYMYYGNATATSASNPCNVFELYEDWTAESTADNPPVINAPRCTGITWTTGGNAQWRATNTAGEYYDSFTPLMGAESGPIGNFQQSWVQTTITSPMQSQISFWWTVGSQANRDILDFSVDGTQRAQISGNIAWQRREFTVSAGSRIYRWNYGKDWSGSTPPDRGCVDYIIVRKFATPEPTFEINTIEKVRANFAGLDNSRILNIDAHEVTNVVEATGFDAIHPPDHTGEVRYQIGVRCPTGPGAPTWYYFNTAVEQWQVAPAENIDYANTEAEVDGNIGLLNDEVCVGNNFDLHFRAFFRTAGVNFVSVDSLWVHTSTNAAPYRPVPVTPGDDAPPNIDWDNNSVYITWTYNDLEGNPQAAAEIQYSNNGGVTWHDILPGIEVSGSAQNYTWNASGVPDGTAFRVRVKCYDGHGWGAWGRSQHNFGKENTPPQGAAGTAPAEVEGSTHFTVTWAANPGQDTGAIQSGTTGACGCPAGCYRILYRIVGGIWQTYADKHCGTSINITAENAQRYEVQVLVYDKAGNLELQGPPESLTLLNYKPAAWKTPAGAPLAPFCGAPSVSPTGRVNIGNEDDTFRSINTADGSQNYNYSVGADVITAAAIDHAGVSYLGAKNGNFYAVNDTGGVAWTRNDLQPLGPTEHFSSTYLYQLAGEDKIFVSKADRLYCLNANNGTNYTGWGSNPINLGGSIANLSAPVFQTIFGGQLYVALSSGVILRINPETGIIMNARGGFEKITGGIMIDSARDYLFIGSAGSTNRRFYAVKIPELTIQWQFDDGGTAGEFRGGGFLRSLIELGSNRIYVGNSNGKLYCLDVDTGSKIWEFNTAAHKQGAISTMPIFWNQGPSGEPVIYFVTENGYVYAVRDNGTSATIYNTNYPFYTGGPVRGGITIDEYSSPARIIVGSDYGKVFTLVVE